MNVSVAPAPGGGGVLRVEGESAVAVADLASAVRELEVRKPRWVWADTREVYPALLTAGVRLARCHDLALTEGLLLAHEGRFGEPRSARAAHARLHGLPVPDDHQGVQARQATLFEEEAPAPDADLVAEVHADQLRRVEATADPGRFRLLVAAESAGALIAAEMAQEGMPWREDVHDELLTDLLGPRPVHGMRPAKLQALAEAVAEAFGTTFNPDSPQQIVRAFKAAGVPVASTRAHDIRQVDHPGVAPLLAYKEMARFYSFHGWAWADQWVRGHRFRPEYVVGGVVTGRWATNGGGALQIHKLMRKVIAFDYGHEGGEDLVCPIIGWATVVDACLTDGTATTSIQPAFLHVGMVWTPAELREHDHEVGVWNIHARVVPTIDETVAAFEAAQRPVSKSLAQGIATPRS